MVVKIVRSWNISIGYNDVTKETFPLYFAKNHVVGKGKGFNKDYDCFEFAAKAVQALSQHRDFYCFAPLVRVDIMRMQCGRLVINELESLEALYAHSMQRQPDNHYCSRETTRLFQAFLGRFWISKIDQLISSS